MVTIYGMQRRATVRRPGGYLPAVILAAYLLLVQSQQSFAAVDAHADAAPAGVQSSVSALASYLARAGDDELTKTRALFRWITGNIDYDAAGLRSGNYGDLSPEGVLRRRVAVCQGYAQLAEALGAAMGLEVRVVSGWSKGYGYQPGQPFTGQPNHAWNAVRIGGRWRLMDPTWGAGHLDERMVFVRRFQEHYFLTDPGAFVYDHLPTDSTWQLLEQPLDAARYVELPHLTPGFFRTGLRLGSHRRARIEASGTTSVSIGVTRPVELLAQVLEVASRRPLSGTWALVQTNGEQAELRAAFPRPGEYLLRLFAKPAGEDGPAGWALDYFVHNSGAAGGELPQTYSGFTQNGVWLIEPMTGTLRPGTPTRFRLRARGATDVAIVANGQWTHFTSDGETFTATLTVPAGAINVFAKYAPDAQYVGLLRYDGR